MSRRSYTAKFKLAAVVMVKEVGNHAAAKRLGINEKNVRLWRKDKVKISSQRKSQKSPHFSKPHWPEMEEQVNAWVSKKCQSGLPVSQTMIRIEAKKIAKRLHITNFPGSEGWLRRFMKQWHLSNRRRTTLAQRLPEDLQDKVLGFQRYIINTRKTHAYPLSHIGNMDETPCSFDMVGFTTVNAKGEKTVRWDETETDGDFQAKDNAQRDNSARNTRASPSKRLDGRRQYYVLMDSARLEHSSPCSIQRPQPPRPRSLCCTSAALRSL